jgi:hypothetical protein
MAVVVEQAPAIATGAYAGSPVIKTYTGLSALTRSRP